MKKTLVAVILLASCSTIREGQIMDKRFYDEYTTLMPIYTYNEKGQITSMHIEEIYTPPCWTFYLKNNEGETGAPCVEARDYMVYNVGQWYKMPEE